MSSDFFYLDPSKIPPRRTPKKTGYVSQRKTVKATTPHRPFRQDSEGDDFLPRQAFPAQEEIPEFDLLAGSADSLTQAMLADFSYEVTVEKNNQPVPAAESQENKVDARAALLAELEDIDEKDKELLRKLNKLEKPSRTPNLKFASSRPAGFQTNEAAANLKVNILSDSEALDYHRAESDWFQVGSAAPERIVQLKKYAREQKIKGSILEADVPEEESASKLKTFLAALVLMLVPVSTVFFLASESDNFLKSALAGLNSKILSTSSFTLVNSSEASGTFPELARIRSEIKKSGPAGEADETIVDFLEKNAGFDWFNIFKKNDSPGGFTLSGVDFLEKAKVFPELSSQISWFNFWNQVFKSDKSYLVILTDDMESWPGGGRPQNYAVLKVVPSGLEIINSAKVSDLDAAFDLKVVPPEAVKVASTAWLPSAAFWFLDFRDSAKTFIDFFEKTTGLKVDGALAVNRAFLKEFAFKENLIFDADSPNWFYGLVDAVSRKPSGRRFSLVESLKNGFNAGQFQLYFKEDALQNFSENSGWTSDVKVLPKGDFLGLGLASIKENGASLDLVEHHASIFEDGSVVVNLGLMLRQAQDADSTNYLKIYSPPGSQTLKAEGFSAKEKIPEFDYASQGFSADVRLKPPIESKIPELDLFEESGLAVAGGWVNLKAGSRASVRLEYLLPFKLARKNTLASYRLKVTRPRQSEAVPFRFVMVPEKNIKLMSLEPNGFLSENLGEYQDTLASDLILEAALRFENYEAR